MSSLINSNSCTTSTKSYRNWSSRTVLYSNFDKEKIPQGRDLFVKSNCNKNCDDDDDDNDDDYDGDDVNDDEASSREFATWANKFILKAKKSKALTIPGKSIKFRSFSQFFLGGDFLNILIWATFEISFFCQFMKKTEMD